MAVDAGDIPSRLRERARELWKRADQIEGIIGDTYADRLATKVCEAYHVDRKRLLSQSRIQSVSTARQVWMYLLRQEAAMTFESIGYLTHRDHSTVMHGFRKVERRVLERPLFAAMVEKLRIEEGRQQERAA
jgi:chromosomal replication initiation ATPase DnaA